MSVFQFKHFSVNQQNSTFKIGTDALVLGAWLDLKAAPKKILDVGTGTGVLSLMMAQKFQDAEMEAWDINEASVALARENFKQNDLGKNCRAVLQDVLKHNSSQKFDLIVSNPPFFIDAKVSVDATKAKSKHFRTVDVQRFFFALSQLVKETGEIALIHPIDEVFDDLAKNVELNLNKRLYVYGKANVLKRHCSIFSLQKETYIESALIVRDELGNYTDSYRKLTLDYHLEGAIPKQNTN